MEQLDQRTKSNKYWKEKKIKSLPLIGSESAATEDSSQVVESGGVSNSESEKCKGGESIDPVNNNMHLQDKGLVQYKYRK